MPKHTIGIDFGTDSARAVLVDVASGRVAATASVPFPYGVIDRSLPGQSDHLPPDWALQHPGDWVAAAEQLLRTMAQHTNPDDIVGLGVDCTSCTVLPVTAEGTPLCLQADFARDPHAWPKLWKHHAALCRPHQRRTRPRRRCVSGVLRREDLVGMVVGERVAGARRGARGGPCHGPLDRRRRLDRLAADRH